MEWVEGIPIIFGKGNWCNRLKILRNQAVQILYKTEYYFFPRTFPDKAIAISLSL